MTFARLALAAVLVAIVPTQLLADPPENLRDENLVAWCIVPFDAKNRDPTERAEMVRRLGLRRVAYDWREQHIPSFEQEIEQYEKHGIEFFAFWGTHDRAFELFRKHGLRPQIWQTAPSPEGASQEERVAAAAEQLRPLVERTRKEGLALGLYNHGGWGGEPANLVAVCEVLRNSGADHVGIVYNLHHAHDAVGDFAKSLEAMKPYLLCLNLNGMTENGERRGRKILPIGAGELDLPLLKMIVDSGYDGPIGVIGHTQDDVEERLKDNLDGLHWLLPQLDGAAPGPRPTYRTWKPDPVAAPASPKLEDASSSAVPTGEPYSPERVAELVRKAKEQGDPLRGLTAFSSATSACLSCHKVGRYGGAVGPDLATVAPKRSAEELVESILWPKRKIEPEYVAHAILDTDGRSLQGYIVRDEGVSLVLRDTTAAAPGEVRIAKRDIELRREVGTLMPENLAASMSEAQLLDVIAFVASVGREGGPTIEQAETLIAHSQAHLHEPATFPYDKQPLVPENWPHSDLPVNQDRLYDFYSRQADWFRNLRNGDVSATSLTDSDNAETTASYVPGQLLEAFPGLDGGPFGHWGKQNEQTWASDGWSRATLDSVQCGVFRQGDLTVPRAVCVRVGGENGVNVCFNPETLAYESIWAGPFLKFSNVRHGFMHGLEPGEGSTPASPSRLDADPAFAGRKVEYGGFLRFGDRVIFSYVVDGVEYFDEPAMKDGAFHRIVSEASEHPANDLSKDFPERWPQRIETPIELSDDGPYAIESIAVPFDNPWKMPIFPGGHAFLPDGSALICTMQGDVWQVSGFEYPSKKATWRRVASGLHQAQGIVADDEGVFVLGRDQITKLQDRDGDGEFDFYERFSAAYETSPAGHDFICGLERDADGNFYIASGNQGLVRVSKDGNQADVLATGFRNPDGLGLYPDGVATVPCSEGEWTPSSMICAVRTDRVDAANPATVPHFGYRGPQEGQVPELPMVYLPRGLDNSSGGQAFVDSDRWGPLSGTMIHTSFGACTHFLLLRDEVGEQLQGAIVPLPGEFYSGVHRGRFSPKDGQLYLTGMQGWGTYAAADGCFQRVRYTGDPAQLPVGFHVCENGVLVRFAEPLDPATAGDPRSHFAQCWNYRYGPAYGSPEFSSHHRGMRGHDLLDVTEAHVIDGGKGLFLELPDLQPTNQLHLRLQSSDGVFHDLFATVHALDAPYAELPNYRPVAKTIAAHPIHADLAMATRSVPNPHRAKLDGARSITIETAGNLSFATRVVRVRPGETIALTLSNPDVVPHNWALTRPGTLESVGGLADRLISDPDAALRHYIPETDDVLAYVDVVSPREKSMIWFKAPETPGRYPYLCTFPGHWKAMNGELIVEDRQSRAASEPKSLVVESPVSLLAESVADPPAWVAAMRDVHAKFDGEKGSLALFGDSITVSLAFWAPLEGEPKGLSEDLKKDWRLAKSRLRPETWRGTRGPAFGNEGGMTIRWADDNVDDWLDKLNPEVAVVMFGTNDLGVLEADEYRAKLRDVVRRCLDNGTIVLLTTIPPRHGLEEKSAAFADIARDVAKELHVPLVDYAAEIRRLRPDDWDGASEKFAAPNADVYDVPTLISRDGVHPSNPREFQSYSDPDLDKNGFALRGALTLKAYADVVRNVLEPARE